MARPFFMWYTHDHHHTGIGLMTPATVHQGQTPGVQAARQATLDVAYQAHPERVVRGQPQPPALPPAVWINPPAATTGATPSGQPSAGYHAATGSSAETTPHAAPELSISSVSNILTHSVGRSFGRPSKRRLPHC